MNDKIPAVLWSPIDWLMRHDVQGESVEQIARTATARYEALSPAAQEFWRTVVETNMEIARQWMDDHPEIVIPWLTELAQQGKAIYESMSPRERAEWLQRHPGKGAQIDG